MSAESQAAPVETASEHPVAHGSTGEGSSSAMARLMSQEQARGAVLAAPEDVPTGTS
jgi:hypothetical protein